jgi:hypothetical protein
MRGIWIGILTTAMVGALATTAMAATPEVSSARSAALGGNLFIQDVEDVYTWPQLALDHRGVVQANTDGTAGAGSALVLFGNESMTYGAAVHTGPATSTSTLDAFFAMPMGDNKLGFELTLGLGGETQTPEDGDDTGSTQMDIGLGAGYSMGNMDIGLQFGMSQITTLGAGSDGDDLTVGGMVVGVGARSISDSVDGVAWGWAAGLGYTSFNFTETDANSTIQVGAAYGPVFSAEGATAAVQATLGVQLDSNDGDTDDDVDATGTTTISVPGVQVATEYAVNDWLSLRGSAGYAFEVEMVSNPDGSSSTGMSNGADGFTWAAGAGAHWGNLNIDAVLQEGFVVNGPNFIGGGTGLASQVSATYKF